MSPASGENHSGSQPHEGLSPFLNLIIRYQDNTLTAEELQDFEDQLLTDIEKQKLFAEIQLQSYAIHSLLRRDAFHRDNSGVAPTLSSFAPQAPKRWTPGNTFAVLTVLGLLVGAIPFISPLANNIAFQRPAQKALGVPSHESELADTLDVRIVGLSQAKFFGQFNPPIQTRLRQKQEYVLTDGLVELSFPAGASAIIEAPAVFRVLSNDCLGLDTGRCSVHTPEGAEGFRVETPLTDVVDRGTRFLISATEGMETEVQVVEGIADVYWKGDSTHLTEKSTEHPKSLDSVPLLARLEKSDVRRFSATEAATTIPAKGSSRNYVRNLPDRVVSYEATRNETGAAGDLVSVTVSRGGEIQTFAASELILADLTWFASYPSTNINGHFSGPIQLPTQVSSLLSDLSLTSGVINPGGQKFPLTSDPVMNNESDPLNPNSLGFAIQFRRPVINGPGPDVVFFELQRMSNPPDGDAFHVSPIRFRPGLQSHTITKYDLTLFSSEVLNLQDFYLYQFFTPIQSLSELEELPYVRTWVRMGFRALAVGIDLSDLGYAENEEVDALFFQDANDDKDLIDPVFIAGLPVTGKAESEPEKTEKK